MTSEQAHDAMEKFANNIYLLTLSRVAMLACGMAGPPLAIWAIKTINDTATTLAIVQQQIAHNSALRAAGDAQNKIDINALKVEMRERTQDRYRNEDAARDLKLRDQRLDQHETRLDRLERVPPRTP